MSIVHRILHRSSLYLEAVFGWLYLEAIFSLFGGFWRLFLEAVFSLFGGCIWRLFLVFLEAVFGWLFLEAFWRAVFGWLFLDGCFWRAVVGWLLLVALTGHQTHVGRVFLVHMQPVDVYFARPTGLFGVRIDFVYGGTSNDVPAKRGALVVVSRDPHPRHFSFKTSHKHHIKKKKNDQVKQAKGACLFIVVAVKFHNDQHQHV